MVRGEDHCSTKPRTGATRRLGLGTIDTKTENGKEPGKKKKKKNPRVTHHKCVSNIATRRYTTLTDSNSPILPWSADLVDSVEMDAGSLIVQAVLHVHNNDIALGGLDGRTRPRTVDSDDLALEAIRRARHVRDFPVIFDHGGMCNQEKRCCQDQTPHAGDKGPPTTGLVGSRRKQDLATTCRTGRKNINHRGRE